MARRGAMPNPSHRSGRGIIFVSMSRFAFAERCAVGILAGRHVMPPAVLAIELLRIRHIIGKIRHVIRLSGRVHSPSSIRTPSTTYRKSSSSFLRQPGIQRP